MQEDGHATRHADHAAPLSSHDARVLRNAPGHEVRPALSDGTVPDGRVLPARRDGVLPAGLLSASLLPRSLLSASIRSNGSGAYLLPADGGGCLLAPSDARDGSVLPAGGDRRLFASGERDGAVLSTGHDGGLPPASSIPRHAGHGSQLRAPSSAGGCHAADARLPDAAVPAVMPGPAL